jgi:hypothetical protein
MLILLLPLSSCFSDGSSNSGADASSQPDAIGVCTLTLEQCENCPKTEMTARENADAIVCFDGSFGTIPTCDRQQDVDLCASGS